MASSGFVVRAYPTSAALPFPAGLIEKATNCSSPVCFLTVNANGMVAWTVPFWAKAELSRTNNAMATEIVTFGLFAEAMIHLRRTWTCGQVGLPKTKTSQGPVPLHPLLAKFMLYWKQKTLYSQPEDWVFASFRRKGKQPRVAKMLVEDQSTTSGSEGWNSFMASRRSRTTCGR